jgi:hypothetical protein
VKSALMAMAKLANVNLMQAESIVRQNPILGEEIYIEEELINLEESLATSRAAEESLKNYPKLHYHIVREQRLMLKHCFGQLIRMSKGKRLPRKYSDKDTQYALSKLIQLLVNEALTGGKYIDKEILATIRPFLTVRQRRILGEWNSINAKLYLQTLHHKLTNIWQTS